LDGNKVALTFQREVINDIIPQVQPDLIHCNDWMTGLIPAMTRKFEIPCGFTFHNTHIRDLSLIALDLEIDVPSEHVEEGLTVPTLISTESEGSKTGKLINIKSDPEKPVKAFVAVKYEDFCYWIDKQDFNSKRVFTFLMILFSLTESGGNSGLPLVTIQG
jgi:Starch synthase catalytic domain